MIKNQFEVIKPKVSVLCVNLNGFIPSDRKNFFDKITIYPRIEFHKWCFDVNVSQNLKYDMAVFFGNSIKNGFDSEMELILDEFKRRNLGTVPVFGIFEKIQPARAVNLLKNTFCDIRLSPAEEGKVCDYILDWSTHINCGDLCSLRKKRIRSWGKSVEKKNRWLKKEVMQIQNQLFRIQHVVDSMEMWQQGRRLDRELKIANTIQSSLLPKNLPSFAGFEFDAVCIPAKEVGGDFFDFFRIDNNRLGFVIGDVATCGIPAALLMTEIRGMWRALMLDARSPRSVVGQINSLLCNDLEGMWGLYVTLFCGIIDRKRKILSYTNAGHCYPVLYRRKEDLLIELSEGGKVLGINSAGDYEESTVELIAGDLAVCYTDGITESHQSGDIFFGKQKLYEIIKQNSVNSVKYIKESICREVDDFLGISEFHDDKALFLFKCIK